MKGNHMSRKIKYMYEGKPLFQYCKEHNINYVYTVIKIKRGLTIEEALRPRYYKSKYEYKGRPISEICKEHNINYQTVIARINRGIDIEEAITFKKEPSSILFSSFISKIAFKEMFFVNFANNPLICALSESGTNALCAGIFSILFIILLRYVYFL